MNNTYTYRQIDIYIHIHIHKDMETEVFDKLLQAKNKEIFAAYEIKMDKNKKMTKDPSELDYYSKKTLNLINAALDKKLKSSKAYQQKLEKELLEKEI